jgi:hypothetical protein
MTLRRIVIALVLLGGTGAWLGLLWLENSSALRGYSRIEEGLYLGEAVDSPPRSTTAVVNLCEREDRYQVKHSLWEPIDGGREQSIAWVRRVVKFVRSRREAGDVTYIHCRAGTNRSAMVTAAYLMEKHNWTRDEALAYIRSKRPQIELNPALMRVLAEWEKALKVQSETR